MGFRVRSIKISLSMERMGAVRAEPPISIIIPTLNEANHLAAALRGLETTGGLEVIVVDGGSADGTPELASALGAKVLASAPGRARQMNAGAAAALGEILLFLHGDTRLPSGFAREVCSAIARPGAAGGAFRLHFAGECSSLLKFIEWTANWRARYLRMPFGDQGIFVKKVLFREVGGFPDIPIMEDVELVRKLRRRGRLMILPSAVVTAARRYEAAGLLRRTLINKVSLLSHLCGVSPWRIMRLYDV